jgi:hypothetical protein
VIVVESDAKALKPGSDELKREEAYKMAEDIDVQLTGNTSASISR